MCAVTLTVVPACSHELPTIGYCFNAEPEVHSYEAKLKTGEQVQPPKTCTESLGGMLYEALNVRSESYSDRVGADNKGTGSCLLCELQSLAVESRQADFWRC